MRGPRTIPLLWKGIYELWRLSWYTIEDYESDSDDSCSSDDDDDDDDDGTGVDDLIVNKKRPIPIVSGIYPYFIPLPVWLEATRRDYSIEDNTELGINTTTSYVDGEERQQSSISTGSPVSCSTPNVSDIEKNTPMEEWEMYQIGAAFIKLGVVTQRWYRKYSMPSYAIHPKFAEKIQQFLNQTLASQSMRPGLPVSGEQLRILSVTPDPPAELRISPQITYWHSKWVTHHVLSHFTNDDTHHDADDGGHTISTSIPMGILDPKELEQQQQQQQQQQVTGNRKRKRSDKEEEEEEEKDSS